MSRVRPPQPVVVTFREISNLLEGTEAVEQIQKVANEDPTVTDQQRATVMAAMGFVLTQLRRAQEEAGMDALVLTTPHHGPASRLQSLIASGEAGTLKLSPLPTGGMEAKFDTGDWFGWATCAWAKLKHPIPHPQQRPKTAVPEPFPEAGRMAVLGDWGTGLYGAPIIANTLRGDPQPYAMFLHLGDVYYSGSDSEVRDRFLKLWPFRTATINRALNSNHEMYSGGEAYFSETLNRFGQPSSYFAYQNKYWTLVGLDVAYQDHAIDDEQVDWLKQILAQAGDRRVVLFSHHQLYSHFEVQGTKLFGHPGFGSILRSKRIFAWYWGHEHRCTIFEQPDTNFGLYARCIGHSGMPQGRSKTKDLPRAKEPRYNQGEWRRSPAQQREGNPLPSCVVLEGRNQYIKGEEDQFSPHGYAALTFDGPTLKEQVLDPTGTVVYENSLATKQP